MAAGPDPGDAPDVAGPPLRRYAMGVEYDGSAFSGWQRLTRPLLFHCLRRFPRWAGLLPAHTPRVALLRPPQDASP